MTAAAAALAAADPVLGRLIDELGPLEVGRWRLVPLPPFPSLLRILTGQQISTRAAAAIFERVLALFADQPTPAAVLALDPEALRAAGQSRAKTAAFRAVAEAIECGDLDLDALAELDDEVRHRLTAVRGIGRWTADFYLLTVLQRPDVLNAHDLGVRQAVRRAYGLPATPTPTEVDRLAESWRPHRSLATTYLLRSLYVAGGRGRQPA